MLNSTFTKLALASSISLLVACGGGGGGSKPKSSSSAAVISSSSSQVAVASSSSGAVVSSSSADNVSSSVPTTSSSAAVVSSSSSTETNPSSASSAPQSSAGGVIVVPGSSSAPTSSAAPASSSTPASSSLRSSSSSSIASSSSVRSSSSSVASSSSAPASSSVASSSSLRSSSSSVVSSSSVRSSSSSVASSSSIPASSSVASSSSSVVSSSSSVVSSSSVRSSSSSVVSSSSVRSSSSSVVSSSSVRSSSSSIVSSSSIPSSTSSVASSSSAPASSSSSSDQAAIDIVDEGTYDGTIPLDETKVEGTPGTPLQTTSNPFADSYFYLSPDIKTMMDTSLNLVQADSSLTTQRKATLIDQIKFVQRQPSAVWMDSIATIAGDPAAGRRSLIGHLDAAVAQQQFYAAKDGQKSPMTVVIIIYNLPDRDCAAFASNGQLYEIGKPANWSGERNGIERYKNDYIKVIADAFTAKPEYKDLRIVTMLEPDSYPNMITNVRTDLPMPTTNYANGYIRPSLIWEELIVPGTGTKTSTPPPVTYCDTILKNYTAQGLESGLGVYGHGLQIAINEFYKAGTNNGTKENNIYTYLDIGHAGWLGWDDSMDQYSNLKRGVEGYLKLIRGANEGGVSGFQKVRGFASNTSGYTPTEEPAISNLETDREILKGFYEWNKAVDEVSYVDAFSARLKMMEPSFNAGFIIDTARNGWGRANRPTIKTAVRGTDLTKRVDVRPHRGHWCNVDKAGVGEVPKPNPDRNRPHLDAFFWMKPPGESDGISFDANLYKEGTANWNTLDAVDKAIVVDAADPKYAGKMLDTMCIPGSVRDGDKTTVPIPALAPHAGGWFHKQFLMLIDNAYPQLGKSDYTPQQ